MSSFSSSSFSEESVRKQSNSTVDSSEDKNDGNVKDEINKSNTTFTTKNKRTYSIGNFPAGYRFCPYDHELIVHYLDNKATDQPLPHDKIKDVDLYKFNPFDLAAEYPPLGDSQWYFFSPRDRKYANGKRPSRRAGGGYWKATGSEKSIMYGDTIVGFERALVFYTGKPPHGDKTTWIMHEYRRKQPPRPKSHPKDMRLDDWVLCKIYEQIRGNKKQRKQEPTEETKTKNQAIDIGSKHDNLGEMSADASGGNASSNSQSHQFQHLYAPQPDKIFGSLDDDLQYHVPVRSIADYMEGSMNYEPYLDIATLPASPLESIDNILYEAP